MANDKLSLFNQAISAAGSKAVISDPDEPSTEANLCRLWYESTRDSVLQAGPWPSTSANKRLALLAEREDFNANWQSSDPSPSYRFAYGAPSDMLRPRYLTSYEKFERQNYGNQTAIMTNAESAILHYTKRIEDVSKWDNELFNAVMFTLAVRVTLTLTGKITLYDLLKKQALEIVLLAATDVANEQHEREEAMPTLLSVRGYGTPPVSSQYIYPYQNLNSVLA